MRCDAVACHASQGVADEDDFLGFGCEAELAGAEHLSDLVEDGGLEWLLDFRDGVCFLGVAGAKVVDG